MSKNLPSDVVAEFTSSRQGNIRIIYRRNSSEYPWLILAPGQGDAAESLLRAFDLTVNQRLNIAVFDPLGHGLSDNPKTDYSRESQQAVWEAILNYLDVKQAFLGGYSYGAYSAAMCARDMSDRIKGLVFIEGGYLTLEQQGDSVEAQTERILESLREFRFTSWEEALAAVKSYVTPWTEYDAAEFQVSMVEHDGIIQQRYDEETAIKMERALGMYSTAVLEGLTFPILLLHSTLPPEKADIRALGLASFHNHAPHSSIVPIPNCGHTIKEHLPFVMNQIMRFISDLV